MANRFIPYIPKPTNEKYSSRPLCKTFDDWQQIKQNSIPIRVSTIDGDLPI
jgi:hypothetical protein